MAHIKLYAGLRQIAGARNLEIPGETVRAALQALIAGRPALATALLKDGQPAPHVRIMINGHDIELAQGLDTPLAAGDQVAIFPPIAGGSQ